MNRNIIDTSELIDQIYHSEDDHLRTGGLWPEYAYTMSIYVDSYRDGMAFGRIHNYFFEREKHFCTLDQILFALEEILDEAQIAQPMSNLRKEIKSGEQMHREWSSLSKSTQDLWGEDPVKRPPFHAMDGLQVKRGAVANFRIRIFGRFHSSMQGTISMDRKGRNEAIGFRSALELLHLLYHSLEEVTKE